MGVFFDGMFGEKEKIKSNCSSNSIRKSGIQKFLDSNEEFAADISDGQVNTDTKMCISNGIQFHDLPGMLKLTYSGLLAKSGAKQVYAVIGYGKNEQWEEVEHLPMQKTDQGTFEVLTMRKRPDDVNIAFRDDAGNWDNNSGMNYVFYRTKQDN